MTALSILKEARALYAERGDNTPIDSRPPRGRVCAASALSKICDGKRELIGHYRYPEYCYHQAHTALLRATPGGNVVKFNATTDKAGMLAVFDQAIASLEAK